MRAEIEEEVVEMEIRDEETGKKGSGGCRWQRHEWRVENGNGE